MFSSMNFPNFVHEFFSVQAVEKINEFWLVQNSFFQFDSWKRNFWLDKRIDI